jgi:hypothetical protein
MKRATATIYNKPYEVTIDCPHCNKTNTRSWMEWKAQFDDEYEAWKPDIVQTCEHCNKNFIVDDSDYD